jgi:hypothetical protein
VGGGLKGRGGKVFSQEEIENTEGRGMGGRFEQKIIPLKRAILNRLRWF